MTLTQRVQIRAVAWDDPRAVALRTAMTTEVAPRYADLERVMPAGMVVQPAEVVHTALAFSDEHAIGHIAVRHLPGTVHPTGSSSGVAEISPPTELEIKRMFVAASARGQGVARMLLSAAESVIAAAGVRRVVLQTGDRQPEAAALYARSGYTRIPVFEPYLTLPDSLCFEKWLTGI